MRMSRIATTAVAVAAIAAPTLVMSAGTADAARKRWDCLAHFESGNRWHINTGNGYYGGLQFSRSTWKAYGGPAFSGDRWPHKASRREQIRIGKRVAFRGFHGMAPQGGHSAWPNTWSHCF